jgi:DUF3011 family protein
MQRTVVVMVWALVALVVVSPPGRLAAQSSTVRCESENAKQRQCSIPADARVELARQISSTACVQGQNWGTGRDYIWVNGGCRADFTVAAYQPMPAATPGGMHPGEATDYQLRACRTEADRRLPAYGYSDIEVTPAGREGSTTFVRWVAGPSNGLCAVSVNGRILQFTTGEGRRTTEVPAVSRITCESIHADRQECRIAVGSQIRLVRQVSTSPCRLNDTYGQGQDYIWVDKGCRAEFEVTAPGTGGFGDDNGLPTVRRIICESQGAARMQCAAAGATRVRLVRQISQNPCQENRSYGLGVGFLWVSNGCRGEFEVTTPSAAGSGPPVQQITCASDSGKRKECRIPFKARVALARQLSSSPCRMDETWGVTPHAVWVTKGCRAEFTVAPMSVRQ